MLGVGNAESCVAYYYAAGMGEISKDRKLSEKKQYIAV
jgi:hypothetical protein